MTAILFITVIFFCLISFKNAQSEEIFMECKYTGKVQYDDNYEIFIKYTNHLIGKKYFSKT